jgi:hypothetical protein
MTLSWLISVPGTCQEWGLFSCKWLAMRTAGFVGAYSNKIIWASSSFAFYFKRRLGLTELRKLNKLKRRIAEKKCVRIWTGLNWLRTLFCSGFSLTRYRDYYRMVSHKASHCDHFRSDVRPHLSYNHSWVIHQISIHYIQSPSSEAGEAWREMGVNSAYEVFLFVLIRLLNMTQNLSTWDRRLTSRRKSCCGFLSPLKIFRPRLGLNPRTLGPVADTVTTKPPRATSELFNNLRVH